MDAGAHQVVALLLAAEVGRLERLCQTVAQIRVSFCADNTPEDVDAFLNRFEDGMKNLQKIRR